MADLVDDDDPWAPEHLAETIAGGPWWWSEAEARRPGILKEMYGDD
jgi:hypothetical protein